MSLLGDKSGGLIFIVVLYSVKVALGVRADGTGATAYTGIGLRFEIVTGLSQFFMKLLIVLDDTVMYSDNIFIIT